VRFGSFGACERARKRARPHARVRAVSRVGFPPATAAPAGDGATRRHNE
jgi:hypothetical protein